MWIMNVTVYTERSLAILSIFHPVKDIHSADWYTMVGLGEKMNDSWKVKNHTQNASGHHFYCFLKEIWILKPACNLKSSTLG